MLVQFDYGKLRTWRKGNKLTQNEVGARLGVDGTKISRWELGVTPISAEDFSKLASMYNANIYEAFYLTMDSEAGGRGEKEGSTK